MVYPFLIDVQFSSVFRNLEYFEVDRPALYLKPEPNNRRYNILGYQVWFLWRSKLYHNHIM